MTTQLGGHLFKQAAVGSNTAQTASWRSSTARAMRRSDLRQASVRTKRWRNESDLESPRGWNTRWLDLQCDLRYSAPRVVDDHLVQSGGGSHTYSIGVTVAAGGVGTASEFFMRFDQMSFSAVDMAKLP
jgi:hypothetical protein